MMQPAAIKRCGREAELVGAEDRADDHVAPGADAAVDLHGDAAAQAVLHENLVRLGKADFPGAARVLDRGEGACARAALIARNRHVIGARLGDAGRDRADADFGNELHRDVARRVHVLQVEDELGEIFDRINIVMRGRGDEAHARRRMAHARNRLVDLEAGQLSAFAGLRALRHLDLHHVGIDEIFRRDAEAARGDLLDRRAHAVAVRQRLVAVGFLAAFAGIRLAADAVHGDGERGVRLARDRAEGHGAGGKTAHDVCRGLHFVERDRLAAVFFRAPDAEQAADRVEPFVLLVDVLGEGAVFFRNIAAHGVLQVRDRFHVPDMVLAAHAQRIFAADVEHVAIDGRVAEGAAVAPHGFFADFGKADAFDLGMGAGEELLDEFRRQSDRVENLRAAIGLVGGDAHLGHHLEQIPCRSP
jgi:hypothetical protein